MARGLFTAMAIALIGAAPVSAQVAAPTPAITVVPEKPAPMLLKQDSPIPLMVVNEVSTKTAHPGDRFALRVDKPVVSDGVTIIPVGTPAWGEVVSSSTSGFVGKSGRLSARLLYVDLPGERIAIRGDAAEVGSGTSGSTVAKAVGFALLGTGPLGLFARGNNARLKAGDLLTGYVSADTPYGVSATPAPSIPAVSPAAPASK